MNRNVARNLKRLREARQMTQVQLGEKAQCGQATVSRLEADKNPGVGLAVLGRLADSLQVDVVELVK